MICSIFVLVNGTLFSAMRIRPVPMLGAATQCPEKKQIPENRVIHKTI
jgi:hypothetical protein